MDYGWKPQSREDKKKGIVWSTVGMLGWPLA